MSLSTVLVLRWPEVLGELGVGEDEAREFLIYIQDAGCFITSTPLGENHGTLLNRRIVSRALADRMREGDELPVTVELIWSELTTHARPIPEAVDFFWLINK